MDTHTGTRLRVGVVIDGMAQPRWIERALHQIEGGPAAGIAAALRVTPAPDAPARERRYALYRLYTRVDRRVFRRQPDPGEPVDLSPLFQSLPVIDVDGRAGVSPETRTAIEAARLDVIICFAAPETAQSLIGHARHGVWYFPDLVVDGGIERPIGFPDTVSGRSVVMTSLNELAPNGAAGRAWATAVSAVNRYSPHYTDRRVKWAMAGLPARALGVLARSGEAPEAGRERVERSAAPGNVRMSGIVARLGTRLAAHALRAAFHRSEWTLAWRTEPEPDVEGVGPFTIIENPPDRFWADPFPVRDGDTTWLFVEEFPHAAARAHLAVMELHPDGTVGPASTVLACPYHLSYPQVFQWRDNWYMVPETLENRTVDLYRSTRFPFAWTHERRLLEDVPAVDATLVEIDGRWWMFTTIAPFGGSENDELHIYMADSPLGPWRPHPGNPQAADVRGSRPAGRVFRRDGAWYRPAQDCSRRYGSAMTIQRIVTLTDDRFEEEPAARIEPDWAPGLLGTHTFNHAGGMTLVDGDRWRPRFRLPFRLPFRR
jgi:hypothetical protein